ncbi:MAG: ribonuclease P protein component [Actinomycetes bacterium]
MLAAGNRMRRRDEFETAIRRGRRAGRSCVTVHLLVPPDLVAGSRSGDAGATNVSDGPRVGFVVGRGVGDAVTRNTVRRRLRHLVKDRLDKLPADALVVIRALPPAGAATSAVLAAELDAALERLLGRRVGSGFAGPTSGRSSKGQRTVL